MKEAIRAHRKRPAGMMCVCLFLVTGAAWGQDAKALFEQGERAQVEDSYARAIEFYRAALVKNPSYYRPMVGLAESYFALEEYEEALRYVQEAEKLAREDTSIMNLEGRIRIGLGDLAEASRIFSSVLSREPNNLEARFGQAELDVASGRGRQAATRYLQSLQIAPNNRKALVSLAYLYEDLGEPETAARYVELALRFHADDPQVHYVAARRLASSDPTRAMEHLELALAMKASYGEAADLLARLALNSGDAEKAAALAGAMVARDRKDTRGWYLLGVAQAASGKVAEAMSALGSCLRLEPDFEMARIVQETLAMDKLPLTDSGRQELADYHSARGDSLREKHLLDAALVEYRRALMLAPEAVEPRVAFASIYRAKGLPRKYLKELEILAALGKADDDLRNEIEVRSRELGSGVAADWKVDQYAIEHEKRSMLIVGLAGATSGVGEPHLIREDEALVRYVREALLRYDTIDAAEAASLMSFDQAFTEARRTEIDYFLIVGYGQTDRVFEITCTLHLGRTGSSLGSGHAYRTGNDRVRDAVVASAEAVAARLPLQGVLLKRDFDRGLVDLGMAQGLAEGTELLIVKKGTSRLLPPSGQLTVPEDDRLGTFKVERVDESVAEGTITTRGFFDRINSGDEVITPVPEAAEAPQPVVKRRTLLQRLFGVRAAP